MTTSAKARKRRRKNTSKAAEVAAQIGKRRGRLTSSDVGKLLSAVQDDLEQRPTLRQRRRARRKAAQKRREAWTEDQLETHRRQRLQAAPVLAASAVWATGECAHLLASAINSPLIPAGSAAFLAATAGFVIRVGNRKRWVRRWSLRFWIATTVAAVWSAIATFAGGTTALTGLLTLALVLLGSRWWRAYRLPWRLEALDMPTDDEVDDDHDPLAMPWRNGTPAPEQPAADAAAEPDDPGDPGDPGEPDEPLDPAEAARAAERALLVNRWTQLIARPGSRKRLAGSALTNHVQLANGHQFDVELNPERCTFQGLQTEHANIAAVFGLPMSSVIIVPHPTRDNSRGTVTFLTYDPLHKGIPYRGPRYVNGFIDCGLYADGAGWGSIQLTDHKNSVMNGLVCGDPGSGKSIFLENLGLSAKKSGCWKVLYCDGSPDGDSSPVLSEHMDWPTVGLQGAWAQLAAVKRYMHGRGLENSAMPPEIRGVNPSPNRVALLWIIDEFHLLAKASTKFARAVEEVIRLGRKKGVSVWVATQGLELENDFAGIATLRNLLTSRNVCAFYSSSKSAYKLVSNISIAPNTLPPDGGYFYLSRPGMPHRDVMLRTDYADDMTLWAQELADIPWDLLGHWCVEPIAEQFRVPPELAREQAAAKLADFLKALRNGDSLPTADAFDNEIDAVDADDKFSELVSNLSAVADAQDFEEGPDHRPEGEQQSGPEFELKMQHYDVINAVADGARETAEIIAAVEDFSRSTVYNALRDLVRSGHLVSPKKGHYAVVAEMQDA